MLFDACESGHRGRESAFRGLENSIESMRLRELLDTYESA
jgi:hypothetical protein